MRVVRNIRSALPASIWLFACAQPVAHSKQPVDRSQAIYEMCFHSPNVDVSEPAKVYMYSLLVARNGQVGAAHAARDYVEGPFSLSLRNGQSASETAFRHTADEIAATFTPADRDALIQGCQTDPRNLSTLAPELKKKAVEAFLKAETAMIKTVTERTSAELAARGLRSPFD